MKKLRIIIGTSCFVFFLIALYSGAFIKTWTFGQCSLLFCFLFFGFFMGLMAIRPYEKKIKKMEHYQKILNKTGGH